MTMSVTNEKIELLAKKLTDSNLEKILECIVIK